jgi:hypothetical protein
MAAYRFGFLASAALGGLLVGPPPLHLAKHPLALHLLLEHAECSVNVVVREMWLRADTEATKLRYLLLMSPRDPPHRRDEPVTPPPGQPVGAGDDAMITAAGETEGLRKAGGCVRHEVTGGFEHQHDASHCRGQRHDASCRPGHDRCSLLAAAERTAQSEADHQGRVRRAAARHPRLALSALPSVPKRLCVECRALQLQSAAGFEMRAACDG